MNIEICCGSFYDAKMAFWGGAKRIELNSALHLGGLTPSLATLMLTKEQTNLKIISMVRPRGAGFKYNEEELEVMFYDAKILLDNGSDGIAFGFLTKNREIDIINTQKMVNLIKSYNKEAVFHRAFDCTIDPYIAVEILINLGVDRILTSGCQDTALKGASVLLKLQENYGDKIEILPASGINYKNVQEILTKTKTNQIHSSCKEYLIDNTTKSSSVSFSYKGDTSEYEVVCQQFVEKLNNNSCL